LTESRRGAKPSFERAISRRDSSIEVEVRTARVCGEHHIEGGIIVTQAVDCLLDLGVPGIYYIGECARYA